MQKDGRVLYLTEGKKEHSYYNIPIANTTILLLGTGTSVTQAAMRMLSQAGVLVGFCGGGGTPLHMATEVEWFSPQSEYRPTEYLQNWMNFWFDNYQRLAVAKDFQRKRTGYLKSVWKRDRDLKSEGFTIADSQIQAELTIFDERTEGAVSTTDLLSIEAQLTKKLYKHASNAVDIKGFKRIHQSGDSANDFLNHGNYLAYGLAASCLWVLGIPHGFAVLHGKTRRGALVFDVADLIKDAVVLPWAFICAKENATEQEFRQQVLQKFTEHKALDFMFNTVKFTASQYATSQNEKGQQL
jgi:CRISPR-associated protein Cas1